MKETYTFKFTRKEVLIIGDCLYLALSAKPATLGYSGASEKDVRRLLARYNYELGKQMTGR